MSVQKLRLYRILRLSVTMMTLGAFLFNPLSGAISLAEAGSISPGLTAAIHGSLGPDIFLPEKETKLIPSDGAADDQFGYAVAISGDTALVSARWDDDHGASSGSAYIFERCQGSGDHWEERIKLTDPDGSASDYFGWSVALSGDTALVGSSSDDDNGADSGSVFIFERDQGGEDKWGLLTKLLTPDGDGGDHFGRSVALEGNIAVVGAEGAYGNVFLSGSAYIFYRDQGGMDNWGPVAKLIASDGAEGDEFGYVVALNGDTVLVGAPYDDDIGASSGSAYVFDRDQGGADNWGEAAKLTASDPAQYDYFGAKVALSGDTALIGAWGDDDHGEASGSAYLFERDQGGADNWGQVKKLTASGGETNDYFGEAVAIEGDTVMVGAFNDNDNGSGAGSVYIFNRNLGGSGNWGKVTELYASDGAVGDGFGWSVAIDGDTAMVGVWLDDEAGANSGSAYIFSSFLANGNFEAPLGGQWAEAVSGNGDGRQKFSHAYSGDYIYLFQAGGGLEVIKQTITQTGTVGHQYTLTLYFGGKNVDLSGKLGARLILKNGSELVDMQTCIFTPSGTSFSWTEFTCALTATGYFNTIEVFIGIQNVSGGIVGVDAAVLNKTGP